MSANEGTLENSELPENKKKRQEDPIEKDSDAPGSLSSREDEVEEAGTSSEVVRPEPRYGLVINPASGQAGASEVTRPLDMYHYGYSAQSMDPLRNPVDQLGSLTFPGHTGPLNPYGSLFSAPAVPSEDLLRQFGLGLGLAPDKILSLVSENFLLLNSNLQSNNPTTQFSPNAPTRELPRASEAFVMSRKTRHLAEELDISELVLKFLKHPEPYLAVPNFTQNLAALVSLQDSRTHRPRNPGSSSSSQYEPGSSDDQSGLNDSSGSEGYQLQSGDTGSL